MIRLWSQRDEHWNKQVAMCYQFTFYSCVNLLSRAVTRVFAPRAFVLHTDLLCTWSLSFD